jgi:hypothetical protein
MRVSHVVCMNGSNGSLPLFAWSHVGVVHDEDGSVHISLNGTLEQTVIHKHMCTQPRVRAHAHVQ